jgi:aspartyl-tRNA(Asn)/glutamyl-tRNA(Gln) amidotransferase subunit A
MGCMVEPVPLESWEQRAPQGISDVIFAAEVDHYFGPLIAGRESDLSPASQRRLKRTKPSKKKYFDAMADCERFRREVARLFAEYDVLVCPTVPAAAHPHGSSKLHIGGREVPARNALRATVPFDLSGSPAVSLPFGWTSDGLPLAVQVVGRHLDEPTVLRVASALEAVFVSERRRPPL